MLEEIPKLQIGDPKSDGEHNYVVEKVSYNEDHKKLYFNKTSYFADVCADVWNFKIGGYQVLDKYLKSRKDMNIKDNLDHVQNIIKVLSFTITKMNEIDSLGLFKDD